MQKSEEFIPTYQYIGNVAVVYLYLYRAAVLFFSQTGMAGVVFVLLQAVQHCLFKKFDLWPCTALCRQRA